MLPVSVLALLLLSLSSFSAVQAASPLSSESPLAAASSGSATAFVAPLSAASGVTTSATGQAFFWLASNGTALNYVLTVSNINNSFMAHIHVSPSEDILVWLSPNPNTGTSDEASCLAVLKGGPVSACSTLISGSFSGVLARGTITSADLSGAACDGCDNVTFSQLMNDINAGTAFVNVHTSQNPGGEIQGTMVPLASEATPLPEFGTGALVITMLAAMAVIALLARFQASGRRHSPTWVNQSQET
jgi:hypothetical protein